MTLSPSSLAVYLFAERGDLLCTSCISLSFSSPVVLGLGNGRGAGGFLEPSGLFLVAHGFVTVVLGLGFGWVTGRILVPRVVSCCGRTVRCTLYAVYFRMRGAPLKFFAEKGHRNHCKGREYNVIGKNTSIIALRQQEYMDSVMQWNDDLNGQWPLLKLLGADMNSEDIMEDALRAALQYNAGIEKVWTRKWSTMTGRMNRCFSDEWTEEERDDTRREFRRKRLCCLSSFFRGYKEQFVINEEEDLLDTRPAFVIYTAYKNSCTRLLTILTSECQHSYDKQSLKRQARGKHFCKHTQRRLCSVVNREHIKNNGQDIRKGPIPELKLKQFEYRHALQDYVNTNALRRTDVKLSIKDVSTPKALTDLTREPVVAANAVSNTGDEAPAKKSRAGSNPPWEKARDVVAGMALLSGKPLTKQEIGQVYRDKCAEYKYGSEEKAQLWRDNYDLMNDAQERLGPVAARQKECDAKIIPFTPVLGMGTPGLPVSPSDIQNKLARDGFKKFDAAAIDKDTAITKEDAVLMAESMQGLPFISYPSA